jgi:hypothetical protein
MTEMISSKSPIMQLGHNNSLVKKKSYKEAHNMVGYTCKNENNIQLNYI